MKRRVAFLVLALSSTASAQELNLANTTVERPNVVAARTGLDHGFVGELGYTRVVPIEERRLFLGGELQMPWATFDFGDYRLRAAASMVLLGERARRWQLAVGIGPTLRGADTAVARTTSLGADLRLTGGYFAPGGFIGLQTGVDWSLATYVANSDAYRDVYAGAKDGWYGNTGGTWYAALLAGLSFGRWDAVLRFGVPRALDFGAQTIPFFGTVGVNASFDVGPASSPSTVGTRDRTRSHL